MRAIATLAALALALSFGTANAQAPTCARLDEVVRSASRTLAAAQAKAEEARRVERRAQVAVERAGRSEPGTRIDRSFDRSYRGEWADGGRNGLGRAQVLLGPNAGEYYIGEFQNNNPHGLGLEGGWVNDRRWTYAGEMREGLRHGLGVFEIEDGTRFAGDYRAGRVLGQAEVRWPSGDRYIGEIVDGQIDGLGILFSGRASLRGRWRQGELAEECVR